MTAPPASRRTKRARTHSAGAPRTSEQGAAPKRFAQEKWTSGRRNDRAHALPGTSALRESCTLPGRSWGFGKRSALPKPGGRCACQICSTKVRCCQGHIFSHCCARCMRPRQNVPPPPPPPAPLPTPPEEDDELRELMQWCAWAQYMPYSAASSPQLRMSTASRERLMTSA